ncbi:hypothetical protein INT48_009169 [Thamnidium elegans]|uniref:Uncharacterized protein n=1 Tax=Thamnidium elegans TaxID=101142 RepID=A0A8H7SRX1_9FUNG|nr:hypothetical protein INT48_009169 [Thamnidium elegans]
MNPTFNFFDSSLYPKVVRSDSLLITSDEIKKSLKNKLLKHEQDSVGRWNTLKRLRNSVCMWMITKDIYYFGLPGIMDTSNDEDTPFNVDKKHETLIKATCTFDIHDIFGKDLLEKVKYIISNNFVKKYEFLILEDRPTSEARSRSILFPLKRRNTLAPPLVRWLMHLTKLNSLTLINKVTSFPYGVDVNSIMFGTERIAQEAIQNANIHCKPRMLLDEYSAQSLTLFSNSKPNAIFHIDILFAYTKLTLLILDGNGLVKEIFDHDYFVVDKCLPSLGSFFSITKFTALNVISLFIPFADEYLMCDYRFNQHITKNKEIMSKIETILNGRCPSNEAFISTTQRKYHEAFVLMYIAYIKELISAKLPAHLKSNTSVTKVGYFVILEKMLSIQRDLQSTIYTSGLVQKSDDFTKLRIITQGERLLPVIQQSFRLDFPLKCFFVLAHLHEDYVWLTINQVVVEANSEEEQEAIILCDKVLDVPNIYEALGLTMWNSITQNINLIKLCDKHNGSDDCVVSEILSLKAKTNFIGSFKEYIKEHILSENADWNAADINTISLNNVCNCKVSLTVDDIVEICFRPVLQNLASTISASLINVLLFGNYADVEYFFSAIYFNHNSRFQHVLAKILKDEADDFNQEQEVDILFSVLPELPSQLFKPVLEQESFLFKEFTIGTLYQVFSGNYGFSIASYLNGDYFSYKNKITDTENISLSKSIMFPLAIINLKPLEI